MSDILKKPVIPGSLHSEGEIFSTCMRFLDVMWLESTVTYNAMLLDASIQEAASMTSYQREALKFFVDIYEKFYKSEMQLINEQRIKLTIGGRL